MTIVFVHGFLGSSLNWGRVVQSLRSKLRAPVPIKAVDLLWHSRGQRLSDEELKSYTTHGAAILEDFKRQLPKEGPLLLVGHSFGIRPILEFVSQNPERVPEIVVEDSLPVLSETGFQFLSRVLRETPAQFGDREEARIFFESAHGAGVLSRFLLSNIGPLESGGLGWRFDCRRLLEVLEEAHQTPLWSQWTGYPGRVQLILGAESYVIESEALKRALALRANHPAGIEVTQIPQSGHWVHSDQLELFTDCLAKIINQEA